MYSNSLVSLLPGRGFFGLTPVSEFLDNAFPSVHHSLRLVSPSIFSSKGHTFKTANMCMFIASFTLPFPL